MTADAIDALVTTDPEVAVPVFEYLKDAVVEEPIFNLVVEETAIAEADQPVIVRAEPERAGRIFVDGTDAIDHSTLGHRVGDELPVFELRQCPVSANPESVLIVFINDHHVVVG
jgi:hypothetical protein